MHEEAVDHAILAVSIVAGLLGVAMLGSGELSALGPLVIAAVGFGYLKTDFGQARQRVRSQEEDDVTTAENALAVLRERYARDELDRDEFEQKLDDLLETETIERAKDHKQTEQILERE